MAASNIAKPHVVCVPLPLQGHIIPMLKLAKLLHHKGFHVTFVNTEYNHNRILESRGSDALNGLPDFQFRTIPLQHHPSGTQTSLILNLEALREACRLSFSTLFRDFVSKLNDTASSSTPPVTCILSDAFLSYSLAVSEELGIPNVLLWNMGASGFMSFKDSREQIKQLLTFVNDPSKKMDESLDIVTEWIPGMKGARLRDILTFMQTQTQKEAMVDTGEAELERASKASAVIFHSFEALEDQPLQDVSPLFRKVFSIGPFQLLLNQISNDYYDFECNLWNEEPECIKWLNSKKPNSVIYINFGSTTMMTMEQVVELAWGLADSNQNFIWITRGDMIMGNSAVLPKEFLLETNERGFIASWCPQEEVLNHPSIGGFLTHSGWNSTLESISSGVPLICWPFFGEHFVNCRKSCNEWGIGMELKSDFKREDVEQIVRELLSGDKGKQLKNRALEWKKLAGEATASAGSSSMNLNSLVNEVLLK